MSTPPSAKHDIAIKKKRAPWWPVATQDQIDETAVRLVAKDHLRKIPGSRWSTHPSTLQFSKHQQERTGRLNAITRFAGFVQQSENKSSKCLYKHLLIKNYQFYKLYNICRFCSILWYVLGGHEDCHSCISAIQYCLCTYTYPTVVEGDVT